MTVGQTWYVAAGSPPSRPRPLSSRTPSARSLLSDAEPRPTTTTSKVLPRLVARRSLADADDIGAVLLHRLSLVTSQPASGSRRPRAQLIAGLIPEALGVTNEEMRFALDQRRDLIEARALHLAEVAVVARAPWVRRLGEPPLHGPAQARWITEVATVAAYRDRYLIDSRFPLGDRPTSDAQRLDAARAKAALRRAKGLSDDAYRRDPRARSAALDGPSV